MALPAILIGALAKKVGQSVAEKVVAEVTADPVVKNAMNSEAPYQSRIGVGASAGGVTSLVIVLTEVTSKSFPHYDWAILLPAIVALWGSAYALYGRFFAKGKPPLFSGKG